MLWVARVSRHKLSRKDIKNFLDFFSIIVKRVSSKKHVKEERKKISWKNGICIGNKKKKIRNKVKNSE